MFQGGRASDLRVRGLDLVCARPSQYLTYMSLASRDGVSSLRAFVQQEAKLEGGGPYHKKNMYRE